MNTNFHPVPCKEIPGFYHIPGYNRFVISKDQEVKELTTGRTVARMYTRNKYIRLHTNGESQQTSALHRLMALTFLPTPAPEKTVVNHIDGNVQNNSIENLEWVTPRENCEHAGRIGLSPKCLPIEIRDVRTGAISRYPSYTAYAKEIGISKDIVRYRITHGHQGRTCFPEMKQYRLASNLSWPIEKDIVPCKFGNAIAVDVRNISTNEEYHFKTLHEAAKFVGYSTPGLWTRLRHLVQPVLNDKYQVKYSTDRVWRKLGDMILEITASSFVKPVQMYNPSTGEIRVFRSCLVCAKHLNVLPTTLNWWLKHSDNSTPRQDGFVYGYYPINGMSVPVEKLES